jgi:hypothetical protein
VVSFDGKVPTVVSPVPRPGPAHPALRDSGKKKRGGRGSLRPFLLPFVPAVRDTEPFSVKDALVSGGYPVGSPVRSLS